MMQLIRGQRLGFVATVNTDGTPNLSPKGTFAVVDAATVAFGDIRSPSTLSNLAANPAVEVNFVDAFTRRGCRLSGTAHAVQQGEPGFDELLRLFVDHGALVPRIRAVVVIAVTRALPLCSPAYDDDTSEDELRRAWTGRFRGLQPATQLRETVFSQQGGTPSRPPGPRSLIVQVSAAESWRNARLGSGRAPQASSTARAARRSAC